MRRSLMLRPPLREDPRFTFGTGKLGDLAGFTSAIILAMIALLIAYEAIMAAVYAHADLLRRSHPDRLPRTRGEHRERMVLGGAIIMATSRT